VAIDAPLGLSSLLQDAAIKCNYRAELTVLSVGRLGRAMCRNSTQVVPKYRKSRATNPAFLLSLCNDLQSNRLRENGASRVGGYLGLNHSTRLAVPLH
jgi:hypothetical protein